jgi:hypothetical protein
MLYMMKVRVPRDDPGRTREEDWRDEETVLGAKELGTATVQTLMLLCVLWSLIWVSL